MNTDHIDRAISAAGHMDDIFGRMQWHMDVLFGLFIAAAFVALLAIRKFNGR